MQLALRMIKGMAREIARRVDFHITFLEASHVGFTFVRWYGKANCYTGS